MRFPKFGLTASGIILKGSRGTADAGRSKAGGHNKKGGTKDLKKERMYSCVPFNIFGEKERNILLWGRNNKCPL